MIEVNGWLKHTKKDNWEEGCDPNSGQTYSGHDRFIAETEEELIDKLMEFAGESDKENVLINACGTDGRVDIQVYENAEGVKASDQEMELFKAGECDIWLADYSFKAERVERSTFTFSQGIPGFSYD